MLANNASINFTISKHISHTITILVVRISIESRQKSRERNDYIYLISSTTRESLRTNMNMQNMSTWVLTHCNYIELQQWRRSCLSKTFFKELAPIRRPQVEGLKRYKNRHLHCLNTHPFWSNMTQMTSMPLSLSYHYTNSPLIKCSLLSRVLSFCIQSPQPQLCLEEGRNRGSTLSLQMAAPKETTPVFQKSRSYMSFQIPRVCSRLKK